MVLDAAGELPATIWPPEYERSLADVGVRRWLFLTGVLYVSKQVRVSSPSSKDSILSQVLFL